MLTLPTIITSYPDMLHAEAIRERDCDITALRIRYFRMFAGKPWWMPAVNDDSRHNTAGRLANRDAFAGPVSTFHNQTTSAEAQ